MGKSGEDLGGRCFARPRSYGVAKLSPVPLLCSRCGLTTSATSIPLQPLPPAIRLCPSFVCCVETLSHRTPWYPQSPAKGTSQWRAPRSPTQHLWWPEQTTKHTEMEENMGGQTPFLCLHLLYMGFNLRSGLAYQPPKRKPQGSGILPSQLLSWCTCWP